MRQSKQDNTEILVTLGTQFKTQDEDKQNKNKKQKHNTEKRDEKHGPHQKSWVNPDD